MASAFGRKIAPFDPLAPWFLPECDGIVRPGVNVANFVILSPRTAGLPRVLPSPSLAPLDAARRAAIANYEGRAQELSVFDASPSTARTGGMPIQYDIQATRNRNSTGRQDSSTFIAQRLAQETDPVTEAGSPLPSAIAAYHRARDAHIEILSSIQPLDIRV
jgi:hypothetical protein